MPSPGNQPHPGYPVYAPTPLTPAYNPAPAPYGAPHPVAYGAPLPEGTVVYPAAPGMDTVVTVPGLYGQQISYYAAPPAPAPQPYVSPLLVKAALVAFILGVTGVGIYFLATALVALINAVVLLVAVLAGGALVLKMFSTSAGRRTPITVQARGRAKVQIHTGIGNNRGRRGGR
ncbi:hypothetical protein OG599_34730 (plasmid) [Streptomyces sp. NBC_01335]|uniref:hypothetical protein n=1 Tax=Streptomyces sp. NBC_01335 TaxID=2903828 RepID=UPI002E13C254|nr:hypothetical protein OG599_34730 [Streptomyces sp. NBC_01335]